MWGALLLGLSATSGIAVDSRVTCPDGVAVLRALLALPRPMHTARPARLHLLRADGQLQVALLDGEGRVLELRGLEPAGVSCQELAQSTALLTQAWLAELPFLTNAALPVPPLPLARPPATPAPVASTVAPSPAPEPVARVTPAVTAPVAAAAPPAPSAPLAFNTLNLRAGGLFTVGTFPGSVGGGGALVAEVGIGRFLEVGIDGAWLTDLNAADPSTGRAGAVVHRPRFGGFGGATLGRGGPRWLTLTLGLDDRRVEASSHGYSPPGSATDDDPTLTVGAVYAQALGGPLFAFGSAGLAVPFVRQAFQVTEPGGALTTLVSLPALELDATAGLGLRFF